MKRWMKALALSTPLLLGTQAVQAGNAVDQLLERYRDAGVTQTDPAQGKALWTREVEGRSCISCHAADPRLAGKHQRTGKVIEPMAPSVNAERLSEVKKIRKWFYRNCKWTLGRECTAQEKADFLVWLRDQ
ncbi:MAG: DUF1924 domain-containing protein [Pseudomonadota bacterium]|jgi:mono/diheme cytochrome c family protein|nr:DUF1924 domain-containing protein [Pseudomonadota bacterium]